MITHLLAITPRIDIVYLAAIGACIYEPQSYAEAIASPENANWIETMNQESQSLHENKIWTLVPLPTDRKQIQCKWVYKVKFQADGTIEKHKARLVAKGFTQKHDVDFFETYSPVIRHDSIRAIFAIVVAQKMKLQQFNIGTTFPNGDLNEEIFMAQLPGYILH